MLWLTVNIGNFLPEFVGVLMPHLQLSNEKLCVFDSLKQPFCVYCYGSYKTLLLKGGHSIQLTLREYVCFGVSPYPLRAKGSMRVLMTTVKIRYSKF